MADQRSCEWPLVFFTVGLQLCCGIMMATTAIESLGRGSTTSVRAFGMSVFPLVMLAVVASASHLGRPLSAWQALSNVTRSRLTAEVAVTSVFAVSALLYSVAWLGSHTNLRFAAGIATLSFSMVAVVVSARIYTIRTQPFWNSWWVVSSFVGSALVIGGVVAALCLREFPEGQLHRISGVTMALGASLVLLSLLGMMTRLKRVVRARYAKPCAPPILNTSNRGFLAVFILFAGLLPVVLAVALWCGLGTATPETLLATLLLLALTGVALGRAAMYSLGTALSAF